MAKQTGLGDNFYIDGNDISGDINSLSKLSTPLAVQDVTDITQFAHSQLGLLRSAVLDFVPYFDPTNAHVALSPLPLTDRIMTYFRGVTIGNPAFSMQCRQINYDWTRAADGSLLGAVEGQSDAFGGEWGEMLTAGKRTDTSATNGPSLDDSAQYVVPTAFGAQAYLQLFTITGTSVDVVVQHAPDNATWATLIDFGAQAAPGAFRGTAAGTVNRYLRVITSGTFSNAVFAVHVVRNTVATVF